jgi:hypothetical protein
VQTLQIAHTRASTPAHARASTQVRTWSHVPKHPHRLTSLSLCIKLLQALTQLKGQQNVLSRHKIVQAKRSTLSTEGSDIVRLQHTFNTSLGSLHH